MYLMNTTNKHSQRHKDCGARTSDPDGTRACTSNPDGARTSGPDGAPTSGPDGARTSSPDGDLVGLRAPDPAADGGDAHGLRDHRQLLEVHLSKHGLRQHVEVGIGQALLGKLNRASCCRLLHVNEYTLRAL